VQQKGEIVKPRSVAIVRRAAENDAEALVALINRAFAVERPIFGGDRIDLRGVRDYLKRGTFLVAEDGNKLLACVYGELRDESAYVGLLSVEPARQGTGLGRRLMGAVEDLFREKGCKRVELRVVSAREPLPAFYRHLGYVEAGIEPIPEEVKTKVPCHFQYMRKSLE